MEELTVLEQSGHLLKMETTLSENGTVQYQLPLDECRIPLNQYIGQFIRIKFLGDIHCIGCGRRSKKSFSQGYCYRCFTTLPQCDTCIMSPEKCHYHAGTCRDAEWGDTYCFTDHFVYLSNTSGVKVGITRGNQLPTRWIDQGATQGLPIFRVKNRRQAGLLEDRLRQHIADRTQWQRMLKGNNESLDLPTIRDELVETCRIEIAKLAQEYGLGGMQFLDKLDPVEIGFPVSQFPEKVKRLNLDKQPLIEGVLQGIKGQYLILDSGVINIRKYTAYNVEFSVQGSLTV
jgi:hypothetical protein